MFPTKCDIQERDLVATWLAAWNTLIELLAMFQLAQENAEFR
jgi:hypothetical protein